MTEREALKLALEAIEHLSHNARKAGVEMGLAFVVADEAITAIKEVLAQPEQDVDWEKLYRLEVKKKEALAAKYERDIKPLTKIVPMAQPALASVKERSDDEQRSVSDVEPVAMRYDFDGYGWKYIDSGSGSDWRTRIKDAEPLYVLRNKT